MEVGQGLAIDAGKQILQSGDVYAPIAIILGLAIVVLVVIGWREISRLNREMLESERAFRRDYSTLQSSVTNALGTIQQAIQLLTAKGK